MAKQAVMALSGGMDSTGLLMHLIANDYTVHALSYDYGQKHKLELERAKANIEYLADNNIQVSQKIVDLRSAMSIFHSALTTEGYDVPEGHYEEDQMKQTVGVFNCLLDCLQTPTVSVTTLQHCHCEHTNWKVTASALPCKLVNSASGAVRGSIGRALDF